MNQKNSLPNPQGIDISIKPETQIYWRDPKYKFTKNHNLYLEPIPITKDTSKTNGSILMDRFNIVPTKLTPINAMFLDPNNSIYTITTNLYPKINTKPVNFLEMEGTPENEDTKILDTTDGMKSYMIVIKNIQQIIFPELLPEEKKHMTNALHKLQKKYIENKPNMTKQLMQQIQNEYFTRVKPVYERYYKYSDNKEYNPMNAYEMGFDDDIF